MHATKELFLSIARLDIDHSLVFLVLLPLLFCFVVPAAKKQLCTCLYAHMCLDQMIAIIVYPSGERIP